MKLVRGCRENQLNPIFQSLVARFYHYIRQEMTISFEVLGSAMMALTDVQKRSRHLSGRKSWLGKSGPIAQRVPSHASDRDNCHQRTKTESARPPLQKARVANGPLS